MLIAAVASAFLLSSSGVKPDHYSERWLCDLWAGAQCHATSCKKDGKERCEAVSKACNQTSKKAQVPDERASKQSACARALLKVPCGAPKPAECEGLM
jgi:hypothetical protein